MSRYQAFDNTNAISYPGWELVDTHRTPCKTIAIAMTEEEARLCARLLNKNLNRATQEQIDKARLFHGNSECEIDDDATTSDPGDGTGYWVQAWVWVPTEKEDR